MLALVDLLIQTFRKETGQAQCLLKKTLAVLPAGGKPSSPVGLPRAEEVGIKSLIICHSFALLTPA
jgi:hypothetical protein